MNPGRALQLGLLLVACAAACQLPAPRAPHSTPSSEPEPRSPQPARPLILPEHVDVLLASVGRNGVIEVGDSSAGPVTIRLDERGLVDARGTALGNEVWLGPATTAAGLELGAHAYSGRLRVRPARASRLGGGLEVINRVPLEEYVAGVLAAELSLWSAQPAELAAQAVASRSFAVHELATPRPYLFDDVRDQAYRGQPDADFELRVRQAVSSTRGQVLVEGGRVVDARFHAACGGQTARGVVVFPTNEFRCLASVRCAPCAAQEGPIEAALGSGDKWRWTLTPDELELIALELEIGDRVTSFEPVATDAAGRWLRVRFHGRVRSAEMSFEALRGLVGSTHLKSARVLRTWPRAGQPIEGGLFIEGRGRGHGVGLCQTGARGYARRGWSAAQILAHYYPGATLEELAP